MNTYRNNWNFLAASFVALCFVILSATEIKAQNIQFTQGTVGTGLDQSIQVPIWTYPGRGSTSLSINLSYSSRVWRVGHLKTVNQVSYYQSIAEAIYSEYSTAGWRTNLDLPIVEWPKTSDTYYYTGKPYCEVCESGATQFRVARVYIHMPDGDTHELRKNDQPYTGAINMVGTFYAVDGSRLRYDSTGQSTGILYLSNGTRYELNGTSAKYIDKNGNTLNYDAVSRQWTDTFGRHLTNPIPVNPQAQDYSYTPPGFTTSYTFRWKNLADALTPVSGQIPNLRPMGSQYLPFPGNAPTSSSGNNFPQTNQSPSLFVQALGDEQDENAQYTFVVGRNQSQNQLFNPVVLAEIVLPNGLNYKFSYNIYGEIDKVTYPAGAFEQLTYSQVGVIGDVKPPYSESNRGVTSRKLSADGLGDDIAEWTYSGGGALITSFAPDETGAANGIKTETYRKTFATPTHQGTHGNLSYYWPFGLEDSRQGSVIEERIYAPAAAGGAMYRRTLKDWDQTTNTVAHRLVYPDGTPIPGDNLETACRNPRTIKTVNLILDTGGNALAKTIIEEYQSNGHELNTGLDLTGSNEYHYASVLPATAQTGLIGDIQTGLLASRSETTYLNNSTYSDARNILGLPILMVLKDSSLNIVSKTETFYDEFSLQMYNDFGTDWTDPGASRGNVTTSRRYLDLSAASVAQGLDCPAGICLGIKTYFDQVGNVWKLTNERGVEAQTEFSATYKHALATKTISAAPDPSGTHGLNVALESSSTFDSTTGLILTSTDPNGQVTSYSYQNDQNATDVLNRLRKVTRPDGGWTKYSFGETLGNLFTLTETKQDATRTMKAYQYGDPLGRVSRSFVSELGSNYIAVDTIYDKLGRVSQVSNPYRTATLNGVADPLHSAFWTTSHYDVLGRVDIVTLPDASTVQTGYSGVYTTITDQAGRQKREKIDALGRTIRVDEPTAAGSLGSFDSPAQPTFYQYNAQGNLVAISQGLSQAGLNPEDPTSYIQHRYFKYDALKRLIYERQVEQAAAFTASDPLTGNSSWSRKLIYDETIGEASYRGLVTSTYDARSVQTQYRYDNLNRVYQVTYSDSTPTVNNYYDQSTPNHYNKGRLTLASTAAVGAIPATSQAYEYDLMGRVTNNQQTVGAQSYPMAYSYNLGGVITSQTYPSGRVVNYGFDDAARLSQVSSGSVVYADQFDYQSPSGLLKSAHFGNGTIENYDYNSRLQVKSLELTKSGTQLQHYDYKYGVYDPNTNAVDESKNSGRIARIEGLIGTIKQWQQNLSYDSLGRISSTREIRGDNNQQSYQVNYNYDVFGNRYQYQAQNGGNPFSQTWVESGQIDQSNNRFNSGITYDYAGNIIVDSKFHNLEFQYDSNNRQKRSANPGGGNPIDSVYDPAGQRVATLVNGSLSNICVYDAMGKLVAEYGPVAAGGRQYFFSDQQSSARVVTDNSGIVISRHDYLPFGEELGTVGMRGSGQGYGAGDNARQDYAGMEGSDVTGMTHTLWREYDSFSGRWSAPDPYSGSMSIRSPQSLNRYTYVDNDPVNGSDPTGLFRMQDQGDPDTPRDDPPGDPFETGRDIIAAAEARHDRWVDIDRAGGDYGDDDYPDQNNSDSSETESSEPGVTDVVIDWEIDSIHEDLHSGALQTEDLKFETVLPLPAPNETTLTAWAAQQPMYKEGGCAEFVQVMAEKNKTPMGLAGAGRWRQGASVMDCQNIKPGTVIASGWVNGYYPNYKPGPGCHTAIFVGYIEGGFLVLEQSRTNEKHATVKLHKITSSAQSKGYYYQDPNMYYVVVTGPPVSGYQDSLGPNERNSAKWGERRR